MCKIGVGLVQVISLINEGAFGNKSFYPAVLHYTKEVLDKTANISLYATFYICDSYHGIARKSNNALS